MTKTVTTRYDVTEHLRTPEEMAAYLEACLEEADGDAAFIAKALEDIARAKGVSQVAQNTGLSRENIYKVLPAATSRWENPFSLATIPGSHVVSVCADCNGPIETAADTPERRVPCPTCSSTRRNHNCSLQLTAEAAIVGMTVKVKSMGNTKSHVELKQGPSYSYSQGKPVGHVRLIDRRNDRYFEKVTDYENGELLHHNEEPLSEHQGHGSARKKL